MQKALVVSPSPFLRNTKSSTRTIMLDVIIAMLPTAFAAVWYFGAPALSVMVTCVISCVLAEWAFQKLTHQTSTIGDLSAVVTGLLLAFNMPASAPWWMGVVGSVIAIVLVKQMFGGIGQNFMNPALAARTILMLSWTVLMAANVLPQAGQIFGIDASVKAVSATPTAIVETVNVEATTEATSAATGAAETEAAPVAAVEATTEATSAATGAAETEAAPVAAVEATTEATSAATGAAETEAAPVAAVEATTEATSAATGAAETEAAPVAAVEATTEATSAATGAAQTEAAPVAAVEATTEATSAATGAAQTDAAPVAAVEATTEATSAATGTAVEATTEATSAATGAAQTEAAPVAAVEATTEATSAATGAAETEAAPVAVVEATTEATSAATGAAQTEAAPVAAVEATTEATSAATGAAETEAAPVAAVEATTESTSAATGTAVEATTEATSAATGSAVEATTEATSSATAVETVASSTPTTVEATSVATPLAKDASGYTLWQLFSGNIPGMLGETCKLTLLLGGLYLILRRVIDWRIPVAFIVTAFILFWIQTGVIYSVESGSQNALYQLLSGGLILGAFFMATDYVTSPISKSGRIIMGIGCAVVLFVIRFYNKGYPEGCSFAILFMNVLTPLIDRYTARKPFGYTKPPKPATDAKKGDANA